MIYISTTLRSGLLRRATHISKSGCFYSTRKAHEPLRILFCGSDDFSIASLTALHGEHLRKPETIASLDVVCRPGKPVGRGLKKLREVPIAKVARELQLPLHQIDTFTGWQPPKPQDLPINLVVAVSFGLLVPPRILRSARYGGLNVHPSLLPEFRGPAPLQHTLLIGRERTGVTVQTLHPKHFDQGSIVFQTPLPGFQHHCQNLPDLVRLMAREGSRMLLNCIRNSSFVSPPEQSSSKLASRGCIAAANAPKITTTDRHIDWATWTSEVIMRRHRVIGPLWNIVNPGERRVIWSSGFVDSDQDFADLRLGTGQPFISELGKAEEAIYIKTCDNKVLRVHEITIDGGHKKRPIPSVKQAKIYSGKELGFDRDFTIHDLLDAQLG
ncbi:uncharacterized protein KY384_006967 [Bacidia gigantensis]|uniref:uncharacterized protein n=1 Tax=Bacidia gigantensis TaxID=2732470 RepID=UPI001D05A63B|nr:uncharacterized protein KY384_006967 [Bacidia gigantensis]KAG8528051.1 hypothetical protein KY384_006967 [Bacidia gigantensis]